MKKILFAAVIVAVTSVSANAADLAYKSAPMVQAAYNWSGFYIGGNIGGGVASSHFDDPCFFCSSATPTNGFFTGGAQIGYNYQFGNGLLGVEADVNGNSRFKESVIGGDDDQAMRVRLKADISGTIRARAGLVVNNALIYVTGGAAWADIQQTGVEFENRTTRPNFGVPDGVTANRSGTVWGGVVGAGVEYAFSPNWTVGAEFLHTMYADSAANIVNLDGSGSCSRRFVPAADCVVRGQLTTDVARIKINYKFAQ